MAKRVVQRGRGWPGIPGEVADRGAVAVLCDTTRLRSVTRVVACGIGGAGGIHGVRAEGKEFMIGFFGNVRAQRKGFEKHV
jgi:hypothetical protein